MLHPYIGTRKCYEAPTMRRPALSQAVLFLVGFAYIGDRGATDLLELLFPETNTPEQQLTAPAHSTPPPTPKSWWHSPPDPQPRGG
jgi:hypothetical protein